MPLPVAAPVINTLVLCRTALLRIGLCRRVIRRHAGTRALAAVPGRLLVVVLNLLIDLGRVVGGGGRGRVVPGMWSSGILSMHPLATTACHLIGLATRTTVHALRNLAEGRLAAAVLLLEGGLGRVPETVNLLHGATVADELGALGSAREIQDQVTGHHVGLEARLVGRRVGVRGETTGTAAIVQWVMGASGAVGGAAKGIIRVVMLLLLVVVVVVLQLLLLSGRGKGGLGGTFDELRRAMTTALVGDRGHRLATHYLRDA